MGHTREPLTIYVHPQLMEVFAEEQAKGHTILPLPEEIANADLVVWNAKYGCFKNVLMAEAKRRHHEKETGPSPSSIVARKAPGA